MMFDPDGPVFGPTEVEFRESLAEYIRESIKLENEDKLQAALELRHEIYERVLAVFGGEHRNTIAYLRGLVQASDENREHLLANAVNKIIDEFPKEHPTEHCIDVAEGQDQLRFASDAEKHNALIEETEFRPKPCGQTNSSVKEPSNLLIFRKWNILVTAATILVALGLAWELGKIENQKAFTLLKKDLADSRMQLAMNYKEQFLAESSSPVRSYWSMETSPQSLDLPQIRGAEKPSPHAAVIADRSREVLEKLAESPADAGPASLELASLEIALGQFGKAEQRIKEAERLLGQTSDTKNLRAMLHLAKGGEGSIEEAEHTLREITHDDANYAPAWYNLALLLQQTSHDEESRKCWEEFLRLEKRPEYRKVVEEHLEDLRSK